MVNGRIMHSWGRVDDLFRVALKGLIVNDKGEILVVKEAGRKFWDLPGGGMDHGESIKGALSRELLEEVGMRGNFTYDIVYITEPHLLDIIDVYQVRIVFVVKPDVIEFVVGDDSDEIDFKPPSYFGQSSDQREQEIYSYWSMARGRGMV